MWILLAVVLLNLETILSVQGLIWVWCSGVRSWNSTARNQVGLRLKPEPSDKRNEHQSFNVSPESQYVGFWLHTPNHSWQGYGTIRDTGLKLRLAICKVYALPPALQL